MTKSNESPSAETQGNTTVVTADDHAYAEALEKILIGFGNGDLTQIRDAMNSISQGPDTARLQERLGSLVQEFHSTVSNVKLGLDPKTVTMSSTNIPDAARKLEYVLHATNDASHKLLGIIEHQETFLNQGDEALNALLQQIEQGTQPAEALATYKKAYDEWTGATRDALSEAVMTQGFQDLCGQALTKVLKLVQEMEENLTNLLRQLGVHLAEEEHADPESTKCAQDNVDDLLKQFGF